MIRSKLAKLVLAAASFAVAGTVAAHAQSAPSTEELGKRIDAIELKLDALIETIADMKSTSTGMRPSGDAALASGQPDTDTGAQADGYHAGLVLDLYAVDYGDDFSKPPAYPTASSVVEAPKVFDLGTFQSVDGLARFSSMSRQMVEEWSGLIRITETGVHVFQIEGSNDGSGNARACYAHLLIDDKKVVRVDWKSDGSPVNTGQVPLAAGLHEFSISITCQKNGSFAPEIRSGYHFLVLEKSPSDRAPNPIDPSRFVTKP